MPDLFLLDSSGAPAAFRHSGSESWPWSNAKATGSAACRDSCASNRRAFRCGGRCEPAGRGGQSRLKMDLFSGDGVVEFQILGVQEIASVAGEAGEIFKRLAGCAVERIADQGMADGCQMDSDLMRAARMQAYFKSCGAGWCRCRVRSPWPVTLTVCRPDWRPRRSR